MENFHHFYWIMYQGEKNPDEYSLYILNGKSTYVESTYAEDTDLWEIRHTGYLKPMIRVLHQGFCYEIYHTDDTDFIYSEDNSGKLEKIIKQLCNEIPYIPTPSISKDNLWYPDDLLNFIRKSTDSQYQSFIKYISDIK